MFRKREDRRPIDVTARMRVGNDWQDVAIHNVSSRGMLVSAENPPEPGTYIEIRKRLIVIVARAVWERNGAFGIRTQDRIDIDALLSNAAAPPPEWVRDGDRRTAPRIGERADRSRSFAQRFQFAAMGIAIVGAAGFLVLKVADTLNAPFAAIRAALGG